MDTEKFGTYAALPAQWAVNKLLARLGKTSRFNGDYIVVADDTDERQLGRTEVNGRDLVYLFYLLIGAAPVLTASLLAEPLANMVVLIHAPVAIVSLLLSAVTVWWFDPEAIGESDVEAS